jgi:hypothetical protein
MRVAADRSAVDENSRTEDKMLTDRPVFAAML